MPVVGPDGLEPSLSREDGVIRQEKNAAVTVNSNDGSKEMDPTDSDSNDLQDGVKRVRAITAIWSKKTLITMFCLLYLISFIDWLGNAVVSALNPFITSSFGSHGLLNIGSILATILGGCLPLGLAKVIDIWGRVEGFTFMMILCVIGQIMKATSYSIQMYIGAHILYWVGHVGMIYVIEVMLSDMTTLTNRMIIYGINGTPRIASTFAGAKIAELFYERHNFRWAFGVFAILLVVMSLPAMGTMVYMFRKATKAGVISRKRSDRTLIQSIWHYTVEIDVFGIILLMAALSCLLLPFSLVAYAPHGWKTPYIIALIVLGCFLIPCFYIWEAKFAPVQFLPFKYLKQGTIIGSCLLNGLMFLSTFTWNAYFTSYLQVVHRQSIVNANYISNAYSLTSTVFAPLIGWYIAYTGNFKWTAYVGVPMMLLGTALIIPLRSPDANPGVLAFTQMLVGFGAGIFSTCAQIAVMSPVTHQYLAVVNALQGLFGSVGAAIGFAVAGAMWNNMLPVELYNRLPEGSKDQYRTIFGDIVLQMSFADGTPERAAIVASYSHVMRYMCIAGAALMPLSLAAIFVWRNINIRKLEEEKGKQTKGMVF